jgi:hypothetical protein
MSLCHILFIFSNEYSKHLIKKCGVLINVPLINQIFNLANYLKFTEKENLIILFSQS